MSKAWPDVKKLLDDPYVSADTKQELLYAYLAENRYGKVPDEVKGYADKYDVNQSIGSTGLYNGSTDELAKKAQGESDAKGYHDRQVAQQVQQNQGQIVGLAAPRAGGGGVATSDEILDLAKPALAVFQTWVPIDAKVPEDSRGVNGPLDFTKDIQNRFDEQRGINFKKMLAEADRLTTAHTALAGLAQTTESQLNSLYQKWSGPAANASYEHYTQKIDPNVKELLPYLEKGPQVIAAAVDTVYKACKSKAEQVLKLYCETVGSATPEIAGKVMKLARGEFNSQDEILEVAAWVDSVCGSHLESTIRADDCGLNDGNKKYTIEQCKKWIRESFNVEFWGDMGLAPQFKKICDDTAEAVDGAWQTVNDYLKAYQNDFPQAGSDTRPPVSQPPPSQPPPNQPPGHPSVPSTPAVPATPSTSDSPPPDAGTHPAGDAHPPDTPAPPSHQETISIKDGDREISVTSPDGQGHVTVTVDDGSGKPKTYDLDFGNAPQPTPNPATSTETTPVHADQDGRCVIHDGPLTITAERAADDPSLVTMTVDDGTGKPATYTLDYSDPANSTQLTTVQGMLPDDGAGAFGGTLDDAGAAGSVALPGQRYESVPHSGEAGLAAAPDESADSRYEAAPQGAMAGGMPMAGIPGFGHGGAEPDRGPARFVIAGDLFDSTEDEAGQPGTGFRISGTLDDVAPGTVSRTNAHEGNR